MSKYGYDTIADFFISFSNETHDLITNLKLQKLMYYAQAWHLAIKGERLFEGDFQAWVHGPVLVNLYNDYRNFRWAPIHREDLYEKSHVEVRKKIDKESLEVLDDVVNEYFSMSAYELEVLTHMEDPWLKARKDKAPDELSQAIIEDEWMIDYYGKYVNS